METVDADENAVLAAAAALIEDVYAFNDESSTTTSSDDITVSRPQPLPRPRSDPHRNAVARLEADVTELERILHAAYQDRRRGGDMAQLWEDVALRQCAQRDAAVKENKFLKETVGQQLGLARRVTELVAESLSLTQSSRADRGPIHKTPDASIERSRLVPVLRRRLDRITDAQILAWACPQPPMGTPFWDRTSKCEDAHRGLEIRNRFASFFPHKLSTVASEIWDFLNDRNEGRRSGPDHRDENCSRLTFRVDKPYGYAECSGPGLVRRMYKADGSVQFTWASIATASGCNDTEVVNLMKGLEMHEIGYARAMRVPASSQRTIVFMELVILKEYKASSEDHESHHEQLKQVEALMQRTANEGNAANWQRLENRFLDASISTVQMDSSSRIP